MKKVLSLFILLSFANMIFANTFLQTPPPPNPFADDDGDPVDLPIDMIVLPLTLIASLIIIYVTKYKYHWIKG